MCIEVAMHKARPDPKGDPRGDLLQKGALTSFVGLFRTILGTGKL